jgi:hypothetical protein
MSIPHVAQAFTIQRTRTSIKTGKTTIETVYGITSRPPQRATPKQILATNRGHWAIENRSHYVRDVTYDEDRSQIRTKNGPRVMASLRNLVIGLLRLVGYKSIPEGNRDCADKPHLTLRLIGA